MNRRRQYQAIAIVGTGAAVMVSPIACTPAFAQTEASVDFSLRGTAATSPALGYIDDEGALSIGLQVDPSIYFQDGDATTATVRGTFALEQYAGKLGTTTSMRVSGDIQHRLDDTTLAGFTASLSSTESALRDFLQRSQNASDLLRGTQPGLIEDLGSQAGIAFPPTGSLDPELLDPLFPEGIEEGLGRRTTSIRLGSSIKRRLSERDSIALAASVRFNQSEDPRSPDYRADDFSAFYSRKLSSRTDLDLGFSGGRVNYDSESVSQSRGDGSFVTPIVGLSFQVSELITASMAIGASISRVKNAQGQIVGHTGLAGRLELCRLQYRETLCVNASRSVQPTSFAGLSTVTAANLSYSHSLGLKQAIGMSVAFTRQSTDLPMFDNLLDGSQSLIAVSARYTRKIGERLEAFASPGYSLVRRGLTPHRENYQVSVGVRYRLGRTR